jgi:nuclear transport factor 2 (NTF2) superfamily protein
MTGPAIAFPSGEEAWKIEQANALLRLVEDLFHRVDIEGLVNGFTPDCRVRFAEQPEFQGRAALHALFTARLARQQDYRLKKTLHLLQGNKLGNSWTGTWRDRVTGKARAGFGVEFWTMRDGQIAVWDAAFNVWDVDGPRQSAVM